MIFPVGWNVSIWKETHTIRVYVSGAISMLSSLEHSCASHKTQLGEDYRYILLRWMNGWKDVLLTRKSREKWGKGLRGHGDNWYHSKLSPGITQGYCFLLPYPLDADGRVVEIHTIVPEENQGQQTGVFVQSHTRDSTKGFSLRQ